MNPEHVFHADLTDNELLAEVVRLAADERCATVRLVASLAEVDARRLHLGQGCSSLFVYCTRVLKLSEHAAYGRIEAARAARRFPILLHWLETGDLTLTTVCLLAPHLTEANVGPVLDQARGRSKRQVEEIIAALRPQPSVAATVRKLPDRSAQAVAARPQPDNPGTPRDAPTAVAAGYLVVVPAAAERPPASPAAAAELPGHSSRPRPLGPRTRVQPIGPARYKLQITIDTRTEEKLQRARDLMRHSNPSGDLGVVLDRALDLLVAELERAKHASVGRPRAACPSASRSRHIPAAVRRDVWRRDEGRCAFVGTVGRCGETGFLEFHHVQPYADDGPATTENIELRCRPHNQYEAALLFADPRSDVARRRPSGSVRESLGPDRVQDDRA